MKWDYGNSWEKHPIKEGEIWAEENGSKLTVCDIRNELPDFMIECDLIYTDGPWNTQNMNSFVTKSGKDSYGTFKQFYEKLFSHLLRIEPQTCYLEIGKQNVKLYEDLMAKQFEIVQSWPITYYSKHPMFLIRGSNTVKCNFDFSGMDDADTPLKAFEIEDFNIVGDLCMGRGLIAESAFKLGKKFNGTELNKRRLAVTIEKIVNLGGNFSKQIL